MSITLFLQVGVRWDQTPSGEAGHTSWQWTETGALRIQKRSSPTWSKLHQTGTQNQNVSILDHQFTNRSSTFSKMVRTFILRPVKTSFCRKIQEKPTEWYAKIDVTTSNNQKPRKQRCKRVFTQNKLKRNCYTAKSDKKRVWKRWNW